MRKRLSVVQLAFILLFLLYGSKVAFAAQRITVSQSSDGSRITWRIDEPVVTQHITEYRNITFAEGDSVMVIAGGCVQTGGHGLTWKRYVNPEGDNSERLYHGLIWIPGATAGLETIAGVAARSPVVVSRLPVTADRSQMFLRLGYDDDNYSDNGYYSHDDGNYNQCRNQPNAWIIIGIDHGRPSTTPPPCPPKPVDLYWRDLDANVLPLNPRWGEQCNHDPAPVANSDRLCVNFRTDSHHNLILGYGIAGAECTTHLPTVDSKDAPFWCHSENQGVNGHVNFGYASFKGRASFRDRSSCTDPEDCDNNINLTTPNGEAVARGNDAGNVLLEYDARETDRLIPPGVGLDWWRNFSQGDDGFRRRAINAMEAIATGVLGFDNVHTIQTELHPVLGLAVHTSSTPHDVWQIMARRSGNEGGCSSDALHVLHDTGLAELRFDLGPSPSIVHPSTRFKKVWRLPFGLMGGVGDTSFSLEVSENGTLLRVPLEPQGSVVFGELHLTRAVVAVRPGSGGPLRFFESLRAAVDAAGSGDTVLIRPGAYTSDNITKNITLAKWGDGEGTVVINPQPPTPPPTCTPRCTNSCGGPDGCGGECPVTCAGRCCGTGGPCISATQSCP